MARGTSGPITAISNFSSEARATIPENRGIWQQSLRKGHIDPIFVVLNFALIACLGMFLWWAEGALDGYKIQIMNLIAVNIILALSLNLRGPQSIVNMLRCERTTLKGPPSIRFANSARMDV